MRQWKCYVVPGSHFDLGWCSTPAEAFAYGDAIIRNGIDPILTSHPEFCFTVEYARFMWHFLETYPDYLEVVKKLIVQKKLALSALWTGMMDNILDGEAMIRNVVLAKRWALEALGVELQVAQASDCPGHAIQLPQVLAKCGVKYLTHSRFGPPATLYRWRAPDGSTVLAVNHSRGLYPGIHKGWPDAGYGSAFALLGEVETTKERILKEFELTEKTATSDHLLLGLQSDLLMPQVGICAALEKWRKELSHVGFYITTIEGYFERVAKEDVPTYFGEMPYEFYTIPAFEVEVYKECRRAENALTAAEKFCSWQEALGLGRYEPKRLDEAWEKLTYPHDHNVGGRHGEVNDLVRLRKAQEAHIAATEAIEEAVISIITHIAYKTKIASVGPMPFVVFNPLSWPRSDVVETYLEFWPCPGPVNGMTLRDAAGRELPVQILSIERHGQMVRITFLFVAHNVPPMGYITYYATPLADALPESPLRLTVRGFENDFFKCEFAKGWPQSIYAKAFGFDIVGSGPYFFNEVFALEDIAEDVDEKITGHQWRASEHITHVEVVENGPVRGRLRVYGRLMKSTLEQDIVIYSCLPRLDFITRIDWEGRRNTQVRIAMPFGIQGGRITYESPYAHVTMPDDEMPNTFRGAGGRFTGKWIDVSNGKWGVVLASRLGCHVLSGTSVYPVILRNTYSCGTPFLWYPQYGWHSFEFSLSVHAGDWRDPLCYRLGWEFNNPLRVGRMCTARPIAPINERATLPESDSFCWVDQEGVIVTTIKKAYDGSGFVVRLIELTGLARTVRLYYNVGVIKAVETDLLERPIHELKVTDTSVFVPLTAYGIHSVKVALRK